MIPIPRSGQHIYLISPICQIVYLSFDTEKVLSTLYKMGTLFFYLTKLKNLFEIENPQILFYLLFFCSLQIAYPFQDK